MCKILISKGPPPGPNRYLNITPTAMKEKQLINQFRPLRQDTIALPIAQQRVIHMIVHDLIVSFVFRHLIYVIFNFFRNVYGSIIHVTYTRFSTVTQISSLGRVTQPYWGSMTRSSASLIWYFCRTRARITVIS